MSTIIGISGSPVKNSNTDRLVRRVLESSGLDWEFVKLSDLNVGPCRACKACVQDNICKVQDDFPALAERIKQTRAMVIGGYTPYGMLDAYTKALIERFWSFRHLKSLNEGRIAVSILSSLNDTEVVERQLARFMGMEKLNYVAHLDAGGNVPCLTCGVGDACVNGGGIQMKYGPDATATADLCVAVETTPVWEEAGAVGRRIGEYIAGGDVALPQVAMV